MINLILGAPGSGKSYEAVAYHILPALNGGRAVVTNLPLNILSLKTIIPNVESLITIKEPTLKNPRPFSTVEDFDSTFKDDSTAQGCLYVIDECHIPFPRGATQLKVEEWFSLHRHLGVDVLLITQSYGKVSKSIIDLLQIVYRVRKNTALGSSSSYVRKVQDGIRGEVVNTSIRKYNPIYFNYYKSHTLSNSEISESGASDLKPIWHHWSFKLGFIMILFALYWVSTHKISFFGSAATPPIKTNSSPQQLIQAPTLQPLPVSKPISPSSQPQTTKIDPVNHPYSSVSLSIQGFVQRGEKKLYYVNASFNAQPAFYLTSDDLVAAGYQFKGISECLARLDFETFHAWLTCDSAKLGVQVSPGNSGGQSSINNMPSLPSSTSLQQPSHDIGAHVKKEVSSAYPTNVGPSAPSAPSVAPSSVSMGYGYPSVNPGGLGFSR